MSNINVIKEPYLTSQNRSLLHCQNVPPGISFWLHAAPPVSLFIWKKQNRIKSLMHFILFEISAPVHFFNCFTCINIPGFRLEVLPVTSSMISLNSLLVSEIPRILIMRLRSGAGKCFSTNASRTPEGPQVS